MVVRRKFFFRTSLNLESVGDKHSSLLRCNVIDKEAKYVEALEAGKPFLPGLIFVSKAGASMRGASSGHSLSAGF